MMFEEQGGESAVGAAHASCCATPDDTPVSLQSFEVE